MTPQEREQFINEVGQILAEWIWNNTRTCLRCCQFDEPNEKCLLYAQRPPARIIAKGCDHFDEEIPF